MNYELNKSFIKSHLNDDVNKLALSKFPKDIDKQFVVRQIQARQILKKKLPSWSENDNILFPKRLSLEQCSSELTAKYKRQRTTDNGQRTLIDLTGGMGVDTSFLSENFETTYYVESQEELCELAKHNFNVLGKNINVINDKAENFLLNCSEVDCIYLDPARRDEYGRKMVSLHDCSPDVAELQDLLLKKAKTVIVKLSPMLDLDIVKKELRNIKEIHIVAVKNECKEVLVVLGQQPTTNSQQLISIDLRENWNFSFAEDEEQNAVASYADEIGKFLYEPGVACMKAACFKLLSQRFNLDKLHRNSHLYTSNELISDFPGRIFEVVGVIPFDKKAKKEISLRCQQTTDNRQQTLSTSDMKLVEQSSQPKASVAVRNFPLSADELRKRLGFKDGDDFYLFGTTVRSEKRIIVLTKKQSE